MQPGGLQTTNIFTIMKKNTLPAAAWLGNYEQFYFTFAGSKILYYFVGIVRDDTTGAQIYICRDPKCKYKTFNYKEIERKEINIF